MFEWLTSSIFCWVSDIFSRMHCLLILVQISILICIVRNREHVRKLQGHLHLIKEQSPKQGWEFAHRFSEWIALFLWKNERMRDSFKKRAIHSFLVSDLSIDNGRTFLVSNLSKSLMVAHFYWATWAICSHRSLLVSDLSNLLTSLIKKRNEWNTFFLRTRNVPKNTILVKFFWVYCSFIKSDLSKSLIVAHLSPAAWAICSRSLFWPE